MRISKKINKREQFIKRAEAKQGEAHKFKSVCASAVANELGCIDATKYLHTIEDLVKSARTYGYTVRSRKSVLPPNCSVGKARGIINRISVHYKDRYIVRVRGHVLLLDFEGKTIVDTDSRKRDARKITHIYLVEPKDS